MIGLRHIKSYSRQTLFAVAGLLVAAGVLAAQTTFADPAPTISGTVSFNNTPAPLNSINNGVSLVFIANNGSRYGASTGANGTYSRDATQFPVGDQKVDLSYNAPYPQQDSAVTHMPNSYELSSTAPVFSYANSSVVQDFDFATKTVAVTVKDHNGNPVNGREVRVTNVGAGTVTTSNGAVTFNAAHARIASQRLTNTSGVATVAVFPGLTYTICVSTGYVYPSDYCTTSNVTVTDNTTAEINHPQPPTISGQLRFNGNPLAHGTASVAITTPTVSGDTINGTANTNSSSNYAFNAGFLFPRNYGAHLQYNVHYFQQNSAVTGVPNSFWLKSTGGIINYAYANVTRDFLFETSKLTVTLRDAAGNPVVGRDVYVTSVGNNTVSTTDNSATFTIAQGHTQSVNPTNASGVAVVSIFRGVNYQACALIQNVERCTPLNISSDSSVVVSPVLPAPASLAIPSPTMKPVLSWNSVSGATQYKVYRDGVVVGTSSSTAYTDTTATNGSHAYYVTAADATRESVASNTVTVNVDTVRPTMTFTAPASFAEPFAAGPLVTVDASDSGSGLRILVIHVYTSANQLLSTCGTATPAQLAAGSMSCSLASLPAGSYYIKAGSFDLAGNNRTINSGTFTVTGS